MLTTLQDAQYIALMLIQEHTGAELTEEECDSVQDALLFLFQEEVFTTLTEEQFEELSIDLDEDEYPDIEVLEPQLFYLMPNYATLLEDTVARVVALRLLAKDFPLIVKER